MKEWALCLPGTFPRLGPHAGALHALRNAKNNGLLESDPSFITTSSVAFIPASIYVQGSEDEHVAFEKRLLSLRKSDFVGIHPDLKKKAAIDFLSIASLLLTAHETGRLKNQIISKATLLALGFPAYKIAEKTIKDIFSVESFLVYDKLRALLLKTLKFDDIFNSSIKIELPAVNLDTAGWTLNDVLIDPSLYLESWKNKGWVSVTNFRPEDVDLDRNIRNLRYVEGGINGLRVFAHINSGKHNNAGHIVDTASLSNLPIHFAIKEGYTDIVVFHYNSRAEAPLERSFRSWVELLSRCFDIIVSENTRKTILGYLRVNNDLGQLAKQRESLKRVEELLHSPFLDDVSKQVVRRHIRETEEVMRKFSYANKKMIRFLFVSSEPVPDAHFTDFTSDQMLEGINMGWKAGMDAVPQINKMIK